MKAHHGKNKVLLTNRQRKYPVSEKLQQLIRRAIRTTLLFETYPFPAEVSVTLVDNATIHRMNRQYRQVDRATDVLSFPLFDEEPDADGRVMLGDIVLSLERAEEQAREYGHSFEREVAFLTVHSMLHLLGYDHETGPEEEREMFARQRIILEEMGLPRENIGNAI